jgi:pimeloyl-ACP methyl ester carboxylesterase
VAFLSSHLRTLRLAVVTASLLTSAAFSACVDSDIAVDTAGFQEPPALESTSTAVADDRATPQQLAVTPLAADFIPTDPAFEPLAGARALFGSEDGSTYQIEVPANWNGEAVFFAHGFRGAVKELTITAPPIREHLITNGYAWAASSYSQNGYEPGVGADDMLALQDVFAREVRQPARSYLYGQSMGGHVMALVMEQQPTAFDGALAECGAIGGSGILDYFLSWGVVSGHVVGVDLSSVARDAEKLGESFSNVILPALGEATAPTREGQSFASVIENLTGGERPFFREGYEMSFAMNFTILEGAVASPGAANAAAQNTHVTYEIGEGFGFTSEELNRDVPRVQANPGGRDPELQPDFADNTGRIERPVLTIHGTGDVFVPISLEQTYRRRVEAAGRGDLLVQRAIRRPGHCNFSEQEREAAFDDLVTWVRDGAKPAGDDLLGDMRDVGRTSTVPLEPTDPGGLTLGVAAGE